MSNGLKIKPGGDLDFLSLGALVHRLDPGVVPFRKATECLIHVSGGEYNVAANLSDCFGLRTARSPGPMSRGGCNSRRPARGISNGLPRTDPDRMARQDDISAPELQAARGVTGSRSGASAPSLKHRNSALMMMASSLIPAFVSFLENGGR